MRAYLWVATIALIIITSSNAFGATSRWGANYFPNVPLITHDGNTVHFFDDLIKDKIVAINFIYTSCPDSCPLETAQLTKVQNILGDRLGKDVFIYSITIDPENDTLEELKKYRKKFGAKWTFLTGKESDITNLRRRLGLYIEEIQDGSNNHNVSMIIGNQKTGRWMKRSPFENAHVLADQLGNWLTGWKAAPPKGQDYADAPELRDVSSGEQLFRTRCSTCHTVTGNELEGALGPDLLGVTKRRDLTWLINWLKAPDQMLAKKDPIAMELFKKYKNLSMPNMRLNKQEALDLITYINMETQRIEGKHAGHESHSSEKETVAAVKLNSGEDVVAIMNAWIREAIPPVTVNAGYMTLINTNAQDVELVKLESDAFSKIEVHEMSHVNGMMKMQKLSKIIIPANGQLKLSPGGKHLMMKEPKQDFVKGQTIDITLTFKSGLTQTITVNVKAS